MQRAVRHLQEGKEPLAWCELSRAAGLWVLLKPGVGLGLKAAVGPCLCRCMCQQCCCSFHLAEQQPAQAGPI